MNLTRTLEMSFANAAGRTATIRVADPRENLVAADIEATMNAIVTENVFTSTGGDLVGLVGARMVERTITEYQLGA
jgi:hypothetical protein